MCLNEAKQFVSNFPVIQHYNGLAIKNQHQKIFRKKFIDDDWRPNGLQPPLAGRLLPKIYFIFISSQLLII